MTDKQYQNLANDLLDDYCDMYGPEAGVIYLLDKGYTREDILELNFSEDLVDRVIEEERKAHEEDDE